MKLLVVDHLGLGKWQSQLNSNSRACSEIFVRTQTKPAWHLRDLYNENGCPQHCGWGGPRGCPLLLWWVWTQPGLKAEIDRCCDIDTCSLGHLSLVPIVHLYPPSHICFSSLPINGHFPPCRDELFPPAISFPQLYHLGFYKRICLDSSLKIFSILFFVL